MRHTWIFLLTRKRVFLSTRGNICDCVEVTCTKMKTIYKSLAMYLFALDESTGDHFLVVTCGRSYLYDVHVRLTAEQARRFSDDLNASDTTAMNALATEIYNNPEKFLDAS